ncbi:manganese peroxidase 1 precursor [Roridomyces roridus]|uniref:Peroxidase n=1 Tax=Roridomyces roridus TaxID=1738132 RepID=A0AAD7C0D9_9AGAR|nr:manganese peroxidase 1 precursor [Roridomyces roridus]
MALTSLLVSLALLGSIANGASTSRRATCPDGKNSAKNLECCALFPVLEDIQTNMFADSGCADAAHTALRVAFHDALGFSTTDASKGTGADGSIFIFGETELQYDMNIGISDAFNMEAPFAARSNISVADFIQFAATISLTKCAGVAQPPFFFGRVDATSPAADNTVPEPFQSSTDILARMADAGLTAADTVALLASHSVAGADNIDPDAAGLPFDSTPSLFDTQFFVESLLNGTFPGPNEGQTSSPIQGELRLQSDFEIAHDPVTACLWQANVNNQQAMAQAFQQAFLKMGILGQNVSKLVDCSDVIPAPPALTAYQTQAFFPPGLDINDVQQSCESATFPNLPTLPGAAETLAQMTADPLTVGPCQSDGTDCVLPPA